MMYYLIFFLYRGYAVNSVWHRVPIFLFHFFSQKSHLKLFFQRSILIKERMKFIAPFAGCEVGFSLEIVGIHKKVLFILLGLTNKMLVGMKYSTFFATRFEVQKRVFLICTFTCTLPAIAYTSEQVSSFLQALAFRSDLSKSSPNFAKFNMFSLGTQNTTPLSADALIFCTA